MSLNSLPRLMLFMIVFASATVVAESRISYQGLLNYTLPSDPIFVAKMATDKILVWRNSQKV